MNLLQNDVSLMTLISMILILMKIGEENNPNPVILISTSNTYKNVEEMGFIKPLQNPTNQGKNHT